jgi:hypothetical protein
MNESALKMRLGAVARVRVSNEDLAGTIDLTNRLRALQDENAVLRRQAGDLTRHNESLRETCSKKHRWSSLPGIPEIGVVLPAIRALNEASHSIPPQIAQESYPENHFQQQGRHCRAQAAATARAGPLSRSKMTLREFETRLIALLKEAEKSGLDAEAIYRIADSVLTEWNES